MTARITYRGGVVAHFTRQAEAIKAAGVAVPAKEVLELLSEINAASDAVTVEEEGTELDAILFGVLTWWRVMRETRSEDDRPAQIDALRRTIGNMRTTLDLRSEDCSCCGATRYHHWRDVKIEEALKGASGRLKRAKEMMQDSEPSVRGRRGR